MAARWTCLMYHDVRTQPPPRDGGPDRFAVTLATFEAQLDTIRQLGLSGCSIADAMVRPTRRVAISFDDGDAGQYEAAFPALVERGMTATFFITTSWVGTPGYVTWDQLREMKAAGMSVQAHTRTHPFLSELDADELRVELLDAKREMDAELDQDTDALALPGGDEPRSPLRHLLADAGYRIVATSRWGTNAPPVPVPTAPLRVHRCTVMGSPSRARFERIVRGDPLLLGWQRVRGSALRNVRARMGPRRYARIRRRVLDTLGARS